MTSSQSTINTIVKTSTTTFTFLLTTLFLLFLRLPDFHFVVVLALHWGGALLLLSSLYSVRLSYLLLTASDSALISRVSIIFTIFSATDLKTYSTLKPDWAEVS